MNSLEKAKEAIKNKLEEEKPFEIGDKVLITKPSDTNEHPTWSRNMQSLDGQIRILARKSSSSLAVWEVEGEEWSFAENWLKHVK